MIAIYKITNTINNKIYIGQSQNAQARWKRHKYLSKRVSKGAKLGDRCIQLLHIKMCEYGVENFLFEVIEEVDNRKNANMKEGHWEKHCNSLVPNGYNVISGGNVRPMTDDTKKKISRANKGKQFCLGRTLSAETKKKISQSLTGHIVSETTKNKLSKTWFKKGERASLKTEFRKGSTPWNKGTKGLMKPPPHAFKKGDTPWNRIPDEIRDKVRNDKRSSRAVAKAYGISKSAVLKIRKEQVTNSHI